MFTLLGALLGFLGSAFPECLRFFREREDRSHELAVLQLQLQQQAQSSTAHLEEIRTTNALQEMQALYQTWHTGVSWVDALNGTVRPVIAYAFFLLYALLKMLSYTCLDTSHMPYALVYTTLWTEEDGAIFAGIISFYFGQRAMSKLRRT